MSFFFQGKTKNRIERCGKEVSTNKEEVLKEASTRRFQKGKYYKDCNKIKDESCYSKNTSGKNITQRTKKRQR